MSVWTVLILVALAATVYSFVCGVSTMAVDGEVRHVSGEKWMFLRVGFQALTAALVLVALVME